MENNDDFINKHLDNIKRINWKLHSEYPIEQEERFKEPLNFEYRCHLSEFRKEQKELFDEDGKSYRGRNFPHSSAELMLRVINQLENELKSG